ncbi:MAG: putative transcriptional regulator, TetR family [Acidimicrobiales bacterium]|nr:putative transcriptional regulator, TetR family [Acidimicrobiales bacterium]
MQRVTVDGRHERSRRTRRKIVVAASELFVLDGYGSTSISAIAARAGVAVQTVYAAFGTKRAVLSSALDQAIAGDDADVVVNDRDWMREVFEAPTAAARLVAYAGAVRRIMAGAGDMFRVVSTAATVDPDVVELAHTTEARRRTGARSVIASVLTVGTLRAGLDDERAADLLSMLNSPATFHHLVRQRGWTLDEYQQWLGEAMVLELLSSGATRPVRAPASDGRPASRRLRSAGEP